MSVEVFNQRGLPYYPYEFCSQSTVEAKTESEYWDRVTSYAVLNQAIFKSTNCGNDIKDFIKYRMNHMVSQSVAAHQRMKAWIMDHIDKVVPVRIMQNMMFHIRVDERTEEIKLHDTRLVHRDDEEVEILCNILGNDFEKYWQLNDLQKLDYLYNHSSFIPFYTEDEHMYDGKSHKFSHYQRNNDCMNDLFEYLYDIERGPNPNVYYFIRWNHNRGMHILIRDTDMSPRRAK